MFQTLALILFETSLPCLKKVRLPRPPKGALVAGGRASLEWLQTRQEPGNMHEVVRDAVEVEGQAWMLALVRVLQGEQKAFQLIAILSRMVRATQAVFVNRTG